MCRGFVKTVFDRNALIDSPRYLKFSGRGAQTAQKVARVGLNALFKNRGVAVPGIQNRLASLMSAMIPTAVKTAIINSAIDKLTQDRHG